MTDLSSLNPPGALREHLTASSRDRVTAQAVQVDAGWWNKELTKRSLPGAVYGTNESGGSQISSGRVWISRQQLFDEAADAADDADYALQLLWQSLAWGAGSSARNVKRRLSSVASRPKEVADALIKVAHLSAIDPAEAYEALRPAGRTLVPYLGPAFFTKYLYFAGQGRPDHPCLILDARVAASLHRYGWTSLRSGGAWPASTYQRYTELLHRWALELETPDRKVAADEIELWLFEQRDSRQPQV